MSKEKIFSQMLQNKKLRDKYWPKENIDILNLQTAIRSRNKNIKVLATLLAEDQVRTKIKNINNSFDII